MAGFGKNDLSERVARLPAVVPDAGLRARVLTAMAEAASGRAVPPADDDADPHRRARRAPAAGLSRAFLRGRRRSGPAAGGMRYAPAAGIAGLAFVAALLVASLATVRDDTAGVGDSEAGVVPLIEASWALERALDALPAPRSVMRADTASTIAALETRIATIDQQLGVPGDGAADPELERALWRDRVQTMSALYQVRFGQAQRLIF